MRKEKKKKRKEKEGLFFIFIYLFLFWGTKKQLEPTDRQGEALRVSFLGLELKGYELVWQLETHSSFTLSLTLLSLFSLTTTLTYYNLISWTDFRLFWLLLAAAPPPPQSLRKTLSLSCHLSLTTPSFLSLIHPSTDSKSLPP